MKKLKLDLEDLAVESFLPAADAEERGTVVARATITCYDTCGGCPSYDLDCSRYTDCGDCTYVQTCQVNESCGVSCIDTCFTCPQSCEC